MAAPQGNQFWKIRTKHGRDKLFESPEMLWEAACEYFQWCDENPLYERKAFAFQGIITTEDMPKMRAYTWEGLELYLDISDLKHYKANEQYKDFFPIIKHIEKIIYNQKFTGAAADLLNPNIIARDLGLSDKSEHKIQVEQPLFGDDENQ